MDVERDSKNRRLNVLFGRIGHRRGCTSEALTSFALKKMCVEASVINDFRQCEPNTPGKDFDVWTPYHERIQVSVKSSPRNIDRAKRRYPKIPIVEVSPGDPIEKIVERLEETIREELRQRRARYEKIHAGRTYWQE